jgi:single-stranded-DNA-specific exonuclease
LKEATALINAARRAAHYQPELAAIALLNHADPKSLVNSNSPEDEQLQRDRAEVKRELDAARKVAPVLPEKLATIAESAWCPKNKC